MKISIRFDGYPLYAFVPEWMVAVYVLSTFIGWYVISNYETVRIENG
jgi:hypothetical protein